MTIDDPRPLPREQPRWRPSALVKLLPGVALLATFGFFFVDKNREARTVLKSGPGLLTVAVVVAGYVVIAVLLRRTSRSQWLVPIALTGIVLGLAAWIVRPYYVDKTVDRTLVSGPVQDSGRPDAGTSSGEMQPPAEAMRVSTGPFRGIDHEASGTASLIRTPDGSLVLRFENFNIEGSPDPQVYLANGKDIRRPEGTKLGPLPGNKGRRLDFAVPAGTQAGAGWTALVWCGNFKVPIANATQAATA